MDSDFWYGVVTGFIAGLLILAAVISLSSEENLTPYKNGQIDALTGNVKYELVVHEDSTRTWEKIKANKEQ